MNSKSGGSNKKAARDRVRRILEASGVDVQIHLARSGSDLVQLARQAVEKPASIIVAAGGDGTISTVASVLEGTTKILGVIPLGTFNYFAKNLGIPVDVDLAAQNLIHGCPGLVDVAKVNEHLFLINSSLGLYPSILRRREDLYSRVGRSEWAAYISAIIELVRFHSTLHIRLNVDGQTVAQDTPLLFIGANEHQMQSFELPGQRCVLSGQLALCLVRSTDRWGMLRLAMRALLRRAHGSNDLQVLCSNEAWIETNRKTISVALDGEVLSLQTPLHYRIVHNALRVLIPQS